MIPNKTFTQQFKEALKTAKESGHTNFNFYGLFVHVRHYDGLYYIFVMEKATGRVWVEYVGLVYPNVILPDIRAYIVQKFIGGWYEW